MKLVLRRERFTENSIIGALFIDKRFECYTYEAASSDLDGLGDSRVVPCGAYDIVLCRSEVSQRRLPLLQLTQEFDGAFIHPGTDGAIGGGIVVGTAVSAGRISNCRLAFDRLYAKIAHALKNEAVRIVVADGRALAAKGVSGPVAGAARCAGF